LLGYILLSVLAAAMLGVMAGAGGQGPPGAADRAVVAAAFMASCLLGMVLSLRPGCLSGRPRAASAPSSGSRRPAHVAHHPDCGRFDDRVFSIHGRKHCGGCLGLLLGSIVGLMLALAYLLAPGPWEGAGTLMLASGMVLVALSLLEIGLGRDAPWLHVLANALLVIGFFLVAVGMLGSTGGAAYGLMAVLVCYLWLDARIQLSDYRHARTCLCCGRDCGCY
jgi:hypothetical protein